MDPVTVITTAITISTAIIQSYDRISSLINLVRHATKDLDAICSRSSSVSTIVENLKQALEENAICDVVLRDGLALKHVKALEKPLHATQSTLDEVVQKLMKEYKPTDDGSTYKVRWQYYFNHSEWALLQNRLRDHIQVLSASMQGLNTLHVLRMLGRLSPSNPDPAKTLRTYAASILESTEDATLIGRRTPSPLPASTVPSSDDPSTTPLSIDERRRLARKKGRLQRELLQAAKSGDHLDVSLILEDGAEVDWMDDSEGMTALHYAAQYGHLRVAELLLDAGADIEAPCDSFGDEWVVRTEKGRTPLIWAAAGRDCPRIQERMCRLLLENGGADPNGRSASSRTALQKASMSVRYHGANPRPTMNLLLDHGAHVNAFDVNGWTALTECGLWGRSDVAGVLLARGAQVDGRPGGDDPATSSNPVLENNNPMIETPLLTSGEWSWNEDLIGMLLDRGADIHAVNKDGKTITELAEMAGRQRVLDMIQKADLSTQIAP